MWNFLLGKNSYYSYIYIYILVIEGIWKGGKTSLHKSLMLCFKVIKNDGCRCWHSNEQYINMWGKKCIRFWGESTITINVKDKLKCP
jgi:hypothetical protein